MSTFEIALAVLLALTASLLARLYRKHLILRHLFIQSSDLCARAIDKVAESATAQIVGMVRESAEQAGYSIAEDEARNHVNLDILNANAGWRAQADELQNRLLRNGMRPLDANDLDGPVWTPWLTGIKN